MGGDHEDGVSPVVAEGVILSVPRVLEIEGRDEGVDLEHGLYLCAYLGLRLKGDHWLG